MAVPGPSTRIYTIDNAALSPLDWSPLIVGEPSGVGELEEVLHDLTGPSATATVLLPVGFTRAADSVITFKADVGGAAPGDPTTEFMVTRGGSRTYAITFVSGWTFSSESYVKFVKPKTPTALLSTLEVTFSFTGAQTVT